MIYTIKMPEDSGLKYDSFRYPAGEVQIRIKPEVAKVIEKADEIHIWATIKNGEIMELAQLKSALDSCLFPYQKKILILPYLPYSRADRRFTQYDCNGLHTFCEFLHSLNFDKIVTLDAHSHVTRQHGIESVHPGSLIETVLEQLDPVTILLPDEGASRYGLSGLRCYKKRDPVTGKLSSFEVPLLPEFTTKNVLIIDDLCDGGGTFLGIAEALKGYDLNLNLYVTHGIFSKGLTELSRVFHRIYTTDSYCSADFDGIGDCVTVMPCGGVILSNILTLTKLWENGAK